LEDCYFPKKLRDKIEKNRIQGSARIREINTQNRKDIICIISINLGKGGDFSFIPIHQ
jgi:hypothetical protein